MIESSSKDPRLATIFTMRGVLSSSSLTALCQQVQMVSLHKSHVTVYLYQHGSVCWYVLIDCAHTALSTGLLQYDRQCTSDDKWQSIVVCSVNLFSLLFVFIQFVIICKCIYDDNCLWHERFASVFERNSSSIPVVTASMRSASLRLTDRIIADK